MAKLVVILKSVGNPDYFQNPDESVSPYKSVKVSSFQEASSKCQEYINKHGLGGGNWAGGHIYDGKRQIAYVSYNGRVWDMQDNEIEF
jgi:hypothetical protein